MTTFTYTITATANEYQYTIYSTSIRSNGTERKVIVEQSVASSATEAISLAMESINRRSS